MAYNIRVIKAKEKDFGIVHTIINDCAKMLNSIGQHYWNGIYTDNVISNLIRDHDVNIVYEDEYSIATFTLSKKPLFGSNKYWKRIKPKKALYLSAFAVVPEKQGKGIGKQLFNLIEKMVLNRGYNTLRLNAPSELEKFYLKRGLKKMSKLVFEDETYFLFEKELR